MSDPAWLQAARADIGMRELPGAPTEPRIAAGLKRLGAWWSDDATPWCGDACAAWMQQAGVALPKAWYRAKGWLDWGVPLNAPCVGCVVVFERTGGGHVGIVVGRTAQHYLLVLGGNQGDAVNVREFNPFRAAGYRWPADQLALLPEVASLPVMASTGVISNNEA